MEYPDIRHWNDLVPILAAAVAEAFDVRPVTPVVHDHPAIAWQRAGLFALTGCGDGEGLVSPVPVTLFADAALAMLAQLSGTGLFPANGALLLGERARMLGLKPHGAISANGYCRLLQVRDGHVALNLPREDDWDLATAMMQDRVADWPALESLAQHSTVDELVSRGRSLGLAIAPDRLPGPIAAPFRVTQLALASPPRAMPLVVDLSALWAGPLAGSLLGMAGARVIKVESRRRPDAARTGSAAFFDLLNDAKEQVTFDFNDPADLAQLQALVARADIIIEASRPRALLQLGIDAHAQAQRGATWISITAYGRDGAQGDAIGFGDDAAVGGGLTARLRQAWGQSMFAGDAIADPLAGITAALAGWCGWQAGGGQLISVTMADVVAFICGFGVPDRATLLAWQAQARADRARAYPLR